MKEWQNLAVAVTLLAWHQATVVKTFRLNVQTKLHQEVNLSDSLDYFNWRRVSCITLKYVTFIKRHPN